MIRIKRLPARAQNVEACPEQAVLDLRIQREGEVDGIGMGVLSDGTPFLNQRGLARMCGVQNAHIGTISSEWNNDSKPRIAAIKKILSDRGEMVVLPHLRLAHGGKTYFAYPESVCMAILEYYAFDAGPNRQPEALARFRSLAGRSLRDIIYTQLGYKPRSEIALAWQQFQDRVSLVHDSVPAGYFCVFREIADLMVTLINAGAPIGNSFVPDISVGQAWSKYWCTNALSTQYGDRLKYEHCYPDYFPQAASNPQTPFCYPDASLGVFRQWMRETYLPMSFPAYLDKKVRDGELDPNVPKLAMTAIVNRGRRRALPN